MGGIRTLAAFDQLDALSRIRPLSHGEVLRLERAIRRTSKRHEQWHWTRADDYRLVRHLIRGRKPAQIAILMKRTERAVWRRLSRLGINVRRLDAIRGGKSSIATEAGK